jgi:predicted CXXCH cytochrome family protein
LRPDYQPGTDFFDAYQPIVLDDTARFWPDGLRKQEAYSLVSHSLSSCFHRGGLKCTSCHDPHGDTDRATVMRASNAACNTCHETLPQSCGSHDDLPELTAPSCVDCHMMRIPTIKSAREMHDHRILAPDPTLTRLLGIPNACASCHEQAGTAWAEKALAGWGARTRPRRQWALDLAAGLQGNPAAAPALVTMLSDARVPWPIAATAGRVLGRFQSPETAAALRDAVLHGRHPMIRSGAAYGLVTQPRETALAALREGLDEPARAARVMIASALIVLRDNASRDAAVAVIREVLAEIPDDVALRGLLAYAWEQAGDHGRALAEYGRARKLSPHDSAIRDAEARCRAAAESNG